VRGEEINKASNAFLSSIRGLGRENGERKKEERKRIESKKKGGTEKFKGEGGQCRKDVKGKGRKSKRSLYENYMMEGKGGEGGFTFSFGERNHPRRPRVKRTSVQDKKKLIVRPWNNKRT